MSEPVVILGIGAEGIPGLTPEAVAHLRAATLLAGGRRHLKLVGPSEVETLLLADNLPVLLDRLAARGERERCVVLATGDPLYYGVGHAISRRLGPEQIRVIPALSSMALAFARVGVSWHEARVASVHGRPLKPVLLPLLGHPKVGLFTSDGRGPADVARFFLGRGLDDYRVCVCEDLGLATERVTTSPLGALLGREFSPLNVVILLREGLGLALPPSPWDDAAFERPECGPVLLTHEDVRALVVRRFGGLPDGPLWDIGAGLGGVAVGLARAFPTVEVVAVERAAAQASFLGVNRRKFAAYNLRLVLGEAPEALVSEEDDPAGVFLGGSGGRMGPILELVARRLRPGGRFVANFVGLESVAGCLAEVRRWGWDLDLTQVTVAPARPLAGLTTFVPERPVWVLRATRPRD